MMSPEYEPDRGIFTGNPFIVAAEFGRRVLGRAVRSACDRISTMHERAEAAEFIRAVQYDIDFVTQDLNTEVRRELLETGQPPRY
jgi:hypothetical protein